MLATSLTKPAAVSKKMIRGKKTLQANCLIIR